MKEAPQDGSTVIVLADDFSTCMAYCWDVERKLWLQFAGDWFDYSIMDKYSYEDELDGYGWVPAPEIMYTKSRNDE